uniref:helix-turn-helix domain-containing protein n=1 Tax=Pseudonocardia pini TaxID=2758030 RepID=UPI00406BCDDD
MDYASMRAFFFADPDGPRPEPPAARRPSAPRALRDAIEPLACLSIWSPEAAADYAELGLDDYFAAYVRERTAPLGDPPAEVVVMALGVFAADLLGPPYAVGARFPAVDV